MEKGQPGARRPRMRIPSQRALNRDLMTDGGQEVVLFEVLQAAPGEQLEVRIENVAATWRQGVWLGTEGQLRVGGFVAPQVVLWHDNVPASVELEVVDTDGWLRLYNVWDSGRGLGPHESQSATSGMLVEQLDGRTRRYRCNDIGPNPTFDKLVFSVVKADT